MTKILVIWGVGLLSKKGILFSCKEVKVRILIVGKYFKEP